MRIDRVLLALLTVQVLFAGHYVAAKWVLATLPAPGWVALRVIGAAIVLVLSTAFAWKRWPRDLKTWLELAGLALFGVVINQVLFIEGLSRTVPSHSALINTSIPVMTLAIAVLLKRESMSRRKIFALVLALAGVLFLLSEEHFDLESATFRGDLLCAINATSFSIFLVLSKRTAQRLGAEVFTPIVFLLGAIPVTLYGLPSLVTWDWAAVPHSIWWVGLAIIIGPTVLTYALNQWALARVESSHVALFIYLQFLIAAPLSAWLLDEPLSWRLIPAALMVFTGVALSRRRRRAATRTA